MDDVIIGLRVRIAAIATAHQVASVLILIVFVRMLVSGLVGHHLGVIVGVVKREALDAHPVVFVAQELHAAIFVACGEDQLAQVGVGQLMLAHAHGQQAGHGIVSPVVLIDPDLQVALWVRNVQLLMVDHEADLLMRLVGVDVGVAADTGGDADHRLIDGETGGQNDLLRVVLLIHLHGVVA